MHGKVQLELDIRPTGDVYLNMWNFQNGADICARVDTENGMLHLDQHDEEFNLLGSQQVHLGDFVRMVQEALLPY
jgi:hypothetical protein